MNSGQVKTIIYLTLIGAYAWALGNLIELVPFYVLVPIIAVGFVFVWKIITE